MKVDTRRCRTCRHPASPIERSAYRRFRSIELTRPDLLYPKAFKQWGGQDLPGFIAALEVTFQAKEAAGDETGGQFDLELIDRRSSDAPAGAASGRKPLMCNCGHPKHDHHLPRKKNKPQPCKVVDCQCITYVRKEQTA